MESLVGLIFLGIVVYGWYCILKDTQCAEETKRRAEIPPVPAQTAKQRPETAAQAQTVRENAVKGAQVAQVTRAAKTLQATQAQERDNALRAAAIEKHHAEMANQRQMQEAQQQQEQERQRRAQAQFWQNLDGRQFEREIAKLFAQQGYKTTLTPVSGDDGIDILLYKDGTKIVGQCKAHSNPVGPSVIRELYGSMFHVGAQEAKLVACGGFTQGVYAFARGKPIELLDLKAILHLQQQVQPPPSVPNSTSDESRCSWDMGHLKQRHLETPTASSLPPTPSDNNSMPDSGVSFPPLSAADREAVLTNFPQIWARTQAFLAQQQEVQPPKLRFSHVDPKEVEEVARLVDQYRQKQGQPPSSPTYLPLSRED